MSLKQYFLSMVSAVVMVGLAGAAVAQQASDQSGKPKPSFKEVSMCVYDPMGKSGILMKAFQPLQIGALSYGVKVELLPYFDERIAAEDFRAGVCDLVNLIGFRARQFNRFTGTIDSVGALPTYDQMEKVVSVLASPKAEPLMKDGEYEVAAVIPAGKVFMFVNDRAMNTPDKMAGKKISVLDGAPELPELVSKAGMTPVASTIANAYSRFNNGNVDITAGPALVFEPMELEKGLRPNGGIIRFPLSQATMQLIIRHENIPAEMIQEIRRRSKDIYAQAMTMITSAEERIPDDLWIEVPEDVKIAWQEAFRQNRIEMRDKGIYDAKALTLFRRIRCDADPGLPECSAADRE